MTFATGTLPAESVALTQVQAMRAAIESAMLAAGWEFVEDYTSATYDYKIYRSPMAANGGLTDFYAALGWRSNSYSMYCHLSEDWDTVAKKMLRYARAQQNVTNPAPAPDTFAWNDTGLTLDAGTNLLSVAYVITGSAGNEYWISATAERVYISTRVGVTERVVFFGMLDDLYPVSVSTGICLAIASFGANPYWWNESFTSSAGLIFTREPQQTAASGNNFKGYAPDMNNSLANWTPSTNGTDCYAGRSVATRKVVRSIRSGTARALFKDMLQVSGSFANGAIAGDTADVLVDDVARQFVCFYNQGSNGSASIWIDSTV